MVFNTKLNNLSNMINPEKGVLILALPTSQSETILDKENSSKVKNIVIELNDSIETDINNAILQEMSKMYKSNINQKFLNSF